MSRRPTETPEEKPRRRRRRTATTAEIAEFLEYLAPPSLGVQEEPFGLQVGAPSAEIRSVVVSPMASFDALSMAASRKQALLLTAAPLLTQPVAAIRHDEPVGSKLAYLLEHRISLYALANSFAVVRGGFDDCLAEKLGLAGTSAIVPTSYEPQFKIAVFTPPNAVDRVLAAAAEAGAGHIGNYSHCSFQTPGTGTFLPREGARPTVGSVGRLQRVDEVRLEMAVAQRELQGVIAAIMEAHPYEEVAYDVYAIRNPGILHGRGRVGELPLKVALETVIAQTQDALGITSIRCSHRPDFPITSLAVASGMGQGLCWHAQRAGAGAFITGSASLQDLMLADNSTTVLIDIGYAVSLAPGLVRLCAQLRDTFQPEGIEVVFSP